MDDVATAVREQANSNTAGLCSAGALSRHLSLLQFTEWRNMQFALNTHSFKIHRLQALKPGNNDL